MGQTDRIQEAHDEVFECNKKEYLNVMIRLIPYVMPKATIESTESESGRQPLSWFGEAKASDVISTMDVSEQLQFIFHLIHPICCELSNVFL